MLAPGGRSLSDGHILLSHRGRRYGPPGDLFSGILRSDEKVARKGTHAGLYRDCDHLIGTAWTLASHS